MNYRAYIYTLALLGALALAAISGGLFTSSDNVVYAADPDIVLVSDTACTGDRCVEENTPPGVNIGNPVSATDTDETTVEYGNTLTYSLSGTDAASFDIDASTGQLITKAPLDHETKDSYSVAVTVDDGETPANTDDQPVTIRVKDVDEPPAAPVAPTVVSGAADASTTSLKVIWHEPENTGDDINDYNVEYKKTTDLSFTDHAFSGTNKNTTIGNLEADTSYQVRVQAIGEGTDPGPWSLVGTGSTNKENNSPPTFGSAVVMRSVFENTSAGDNIGAPVTANDDDATTLTYRLEGPDAALFAFVTSSGQIRTKAPLNYEDPECGYVAPTNGGTTECTHSVTVAVSDGAGGSDAKAVSITVSDRQEPVEAPARPTVRATENWSTRLDVSWNAPENAGPPITGYEVRYREGSSGAFLNDNCGSTGDDNCVNITGTKTTIVGPAAADPIPAGLEPGASYQVQVLTIIAGGRKSVWSDLGTGRTSPANKEPRFDNRPSSGDGSTSGSDYTTSRNVDENTPSGRPVGGAVRAEDGDGHPRTYKLVAVSGSDTDVDKFDIDESSGQIRTKEPLNHEDTGCDYDEGDDPTECTYTVSVEVRDDYTTHKVKLKESEISADDTIKVTINVRDKQEPPAVPTVTVTSPEGNTTLDVIWDVPANTGPDITFYDVQYRKGSGAYSDDNCGSETVDNCTDIAAGTTTTIQGLEANTSYSVQVRAKNAEGTSAWSRVVTVKTNKETNVPPNFSGASNSFDVAENTTSGRPVGSVAASDGDSTTWTYRLEGVDAASFSFNTRNGDITTRSSLNFEAKGTYSVRVRANDGNDGGSASLTVMINVTNVDEPPEPPALPRVTATADLGWSLDVTWNEPPRNTGKPSITDYDIRYRKKGEDENAWENWPHGADEATDGNGNTKRSAKITTIGTPEVHLEPRTEYEVEVRATNAEGTSDWSSIGTGRTGAGNSRPSFDITTAVVTLSVNENTRSGQNVGSAVSATDADSNRLTYSLEGPNKDLFTIVSSSGQIKTRAALDHEKRSSYSVTVKVDDGTRRANSAAAKSVTIEVNDVDEIPPPPGAPTVSGIPGSTDSVRVTWGASANTGPAITDYEVRYGEAGSGGWTTLVGRTGADRSQIISDLTSGTRYEVQVRAKSAEGTGEWSRSGIGSPNPDVENRAPTFSGGTRSFSVPENTVPGTDVGSLVTATDRDGDNLSYTLEGTDAPSFSILSTGGGAQIQTSAALNHEEKSSYAVTVRVTDGRGGTDAINLTIRVTDVDGEAPDTPLVPTVTGASSTSLSVSWDAPDNQGPPITDYDYRYRTTGTWTEVTNTRITGTTVTIDELTASTLYEVEVRATNAEGTSAWSNSGFGSTNAPGANNPPVFTEGASATRSVSATSPAGTNVGDPVAATDADSDDTLTYSLEGTNAAEFDIVATSGQIQTKAGVTLTVGTTYNVTVVADDTKDRTTIEVTIEATAAPPNNPPVFSDGASTTRSVLEGTSAGTSIGGPVRATDPDTGDTVTHSLEGQDAASFSIVASSGQIRTLAALDASTKATYAVTVRAADGRGGNATIDVTITVTARPTTFGCATRGTVDASNTGLVADCEALLRARNNLENGARILNWSVVRPISEWQGVTVSGTPQRVTRLNLRSLGLVGTIPADLNELTMLTRLWLHNNSLTGEIPNLNRLTNLESLWLSGSDMDLTGDISRLGLGSKTRLDTVSLWGNRLTGSIPDLSRLTSLVRLKLQSNSLSGGVPATLGNLGSLRDLRLRNNNLRGSIPSQLSNIASLQILALENTGLTGSIPDLSGLTRLRTLNLRDNNLTGSIPTWLEDMDNMVILNLHTNQLTGSIPSELGSMSNLLRLYLHRNQLTGNIPSELGDLGDTLTHLWLAGNTGLTGCVPSALSGVANNDLNDFHLSICQ